MFSTRKRRRTDKHATTLWEEFLARPLGQSPSRFPSARVADELSLCSLYVGSLNFALTESDIRQVFQPFGAVELVDLHKDPVSGKSKGYAFVQ